MRIYKVLATIVYDYDNHLIGEILGYDLLDSKNPDALDYRLRSQGFYVSSKPQWSGQCFMIDLDYEFTFSPYVKIFGVYKDILERRILTEARDGKLRLLDEDL